MVAPSPIWRSLPSNLKRKIHAFVIGSTYLEMRSPPSAYRQTSSLTERSKAESLLNCRAKIFLPTLLPTLVPHFKRGFG